MLQTSRIFWVILIIEIFLAEIESQDYAIAYIIASNFSERLPNNSIIIYDRNRFDSTVFMNSHSRERYSNLEWLKNIPALNSQTILSPEFLGSLQIEKSHLPQKMFAQNMQIVIIQIDISKISNDQLDSYSINQTIPAGIASIFGFDFGKQPPCPINIQQNTVDQNTAIIEECFKNSKKKSVMTPITIGFLEMLIRYGTIIVIYISLTSLIACGGPFVTIWRHKRQTSIQSHV